MRLLPLGQQGRCKVKSNGSAKRSQLRQPRCCDTFAGSMT
jgi:hypothetical protein